MRILIFGLPGSGKTTFAKKLSARHAYFNADEVRRMFNDWDFSMEGRTRQAQRMACLSSLAEGSAIIDFVCPFDEDRHEYDVKIWMNTIKEGRFKDTNKMFEKPSHCTFEIKDYNYENIIKEIKKKYDK